MTRFLIRYWTLYPAAGGIVRIPPLCTAVDVFVPVASGHLLDAIVGAKGAGEPVLVWRELAIFVLLVVIFRMLSQRSDSNYKSDLSPSHGGTCQTDIRKDPAIFR